MNTRTIIVVTAFLGFLTAGTAAAFQYLKPQPSATLVSPLSYTPREVSDEVPPDVLAAVVQEEVPTPPISPSVSPSLTPKKSFTPAPTLTPTPTPIPTIDPKWKIIPGREEPIDPRTEKIKKLSSLNWCVPVDKQDKKIGFYNGEPQICTGPADSTVQWFRDCVSSKKTMGDGKKTMEAINQCINEINI